MNEDMVVIGRVSPVPKGPYSPDREYKKLDVVNYLGNLYLAKKANIGTPPEPEDNEYWMLAVEAGSGSAEGIDYDNSGGKLEADNVQGALDEIAEDYVKKDDYAQVGFAGIVQPDGKTIKVGDEGLLTAGTAGFTGTKEEYAIAMAEGQIEPGTIVFITDDFSPSAGSNIRIGEKSEIEAALEAGEIEDWTVLVILDDFVEPVVIDKEEIEEIRNVAVSAQEMANAAKNKADTAKSESFALTNINGWKKALEFTGASLALNFSLTASDAGLAVSGVLNALLNSKAAISQLSSSDIDRLHMVDKAAVVFADDRTVLYFHTLANVARFELVITGAYEQAILENVNESAPDGAYIFDFAIDTGIIADRAQTDGSGNVITETYVPLNTHEVKNFVTVLTEEELINASNEIYNSAVNHGVFEAVISVNTQGLSLVGGVWYIRGFRSSATNGFMVAERYNVTAEKPYTKTRNISGGVWGNWI